MEESVQLKKTFSSHTKTSFSRAFHHKMKRCTQPDPSEKPFGKVRYLIPSEIKENQLPVYDFVLLIHYDLPPASCWKQFTSYMHPLLRCKKLSADSTDSAEQILGGPRRSSYRLCFPMFKTAAASQTADEHARIVEQLCQAGLHVDIIDGGHSKEDIHSDFVILFVHASSEAVEQCLQSLRHQHWIENGNIIDFVDNMQDQSRHPPTPAERIQITSYLMEQKAKNIAPSVNPWVHDMFPVHDPMMNTQLIQKWVMSWRIFEMESKSKQKRVINHVCEHFGEKVAFYFAFLNFYQRMLIPLALLGMLYSLTLYSGILSMQRYMQVLPFWGFLVAVIWSFTFLKLWDRHNVELQFEWSHKIHTKEIEYPNKLFHGDLKVNSLTGEMESQYSSWRRYPKYLCVIIFLMLQMLIMLFFVASWVTIYEILKASYRDDHFLSVQWFLILLEGIVFGFFVDVIQWNIIVTNMARIFTHWENYRTEEQYERAMIAKLFLLDFLNYYTWFFSLAFVFAIPGAGNYIMNGLNHIFFRDAMNCCFGPYVDVHGQCISCPVGPEDATCIECHGIFTFDRHHVDLAAMFVTPIVVTQSLYIAIGVIVPVFVKWKRERARAAADARAHKRAIEAGPMRIIGSLDYDPNQSGNHNGSYLLNKLHARYLEYTPQEIEVLNKKAREILFESEQDMYDPYSDYHALTVQFGFTVMFSIFWPPMPLACFLINCIKRRTDAYRLCKTLKRPIPRKANGIGAWRTVFVVFSLVAVLVNVLLICLSTGSIEFYSDICVTDIEHQLSKQKKTFIDYRMGPNFGCMHLQWRLLLIFVLEHLFLGIAYMIMNRYSGIPKPIESFLQAKEKRVKELLKSHESSLFPTLESVDEWIKMPFAVPKPIKGLLAEAENEEREADRKKSGEADGRDKNRRHFLSSSTVQFRTVIEEEGSWIEPLPSNGILARARGELVNKWSVDDDCI